MDTRKRRNKGNVKKTTEESRPNEKRDKGTKKLSKGGLSWFMIFALFTIALILWFVIGYFISPITALPYDGWKNIPLSGKFEINNKLTSGIKIPLNAPESVEVDKKGNLYAGLQDGRIVKIHPSVDGAIGLGEVENITSGVFEEAGTTDGSANGRPMGMRLRADMLYAMDAVYGFYKIDLKTKKVTFLVAPQDLSPAMKFPNDLDITSDRKYAYFTDSSYRYTMKDVAHIGLLDGSCTGRILRYEFSTKKCVVVGEDFCFNNGIQLTKGEKTVLMSETGRSRALIVDVSSGKTLKIIPFPMLPDNIRRSNRGTYWLAGANVPTLLGKLSVQSPALRQAAAGAMPPILIMLSMPLMFQSNYNIVVELNDNGEILQTLQDPSGSLITGASQVTELSDGRLVVGSYIGPNAAIVTI